MSRAFLFCTTTKKENKIPLGAELTFGAIYSHRGSHPSLFLVQPRAVKFQERRKRCLPAFDRVGAHQRHGRNHLPVFWGSLLTFWRSVRSYTHALRDLLAVNRWGNLTIRRLPDRLTFFMQGRSHLQAAAIRAVACVGVGGTYGEKDDRKETKYNKETSCFGCNTHPGHVALCVQCRVSSRGSVKAIRQNTNSVETKGEVHCARLVFVPCSGT